MKILLITDALPPAVLGGSGRIVWEIATGFARSGHDVSVMTAAKKGSMPPQKDGVTILTIEPKGKRWMHYRSVFSKKRAADVLAHIDAIKPDIIHAHLIAGQSSYVWIPAAKRRGIPVILTCHDVMNIAYARILPDSRHVWFRDAMRFRWSWNPFRNVIIRQILNRDCTVLTVSDALKNRMEAEGFTNLQTLHNGIDLSYWKAEKTKESARTALNLPKDAMLFLLAGRLGPDKGTEPVAAALPANAHLVIAGTLQEPVFDHLGERLHKLPSLSAEEMRLLYTAIDISLVPSLCLDCFPTICLESMACSRPVIATVMGGARESIVEGKTGWILDPRDTTLFAKRMQWCMDHPAELQTMGKAGREHMEQEFSQESFLRALLDIYKTKTGTL